MQKLLLTQEDIIKILPISASQLEKSRSTKPELITEGKCPPFEKRGTSVYYHPSDIHEFISNYEKNNDFKKSNSKINARLCY